MNIFKKVKNFFVKKKTDTKEKSQVKSEPCLKSRIVSGVMAAAFALTSIGSTDIPASAANGYTLHWETLSYSNKDERYLNAYHFYGLNALDSGVDTLFCLEWYQDALNGATYPESYPIQVNNRNLTLSDAETMGMIQLYGFPYGSTSNSSYIATQILIWEYFEGERTSAKSGFKSLGGEVRSAYIQDGILSGGVKTAYQNIIKQIQEQHYLKANYDKSVYNMTWNSSTNRYEANVYDSNGLINDSNLKTVLENNGYTVEISSDYNAVVSSTEAKTASYTINKVFPNAAEEKDFIGLNGHSSYYRGYDIDGDYHSVSDSQSFGFSSYYDDVEWTIAFKAESKPSLTVSKEFYESYGIKISSASRLKALAEEAEFMLQTSNRYVVASTTGTGAYAFASTTQSKDNATIFKLDPNSMSFIIREMPSGYYTILENKTPDGFESLSNESFYIENAKNKSITVKNKHHVEESGNIEKTINKEWYLYDESKFETNPKTEERITTKYLYDNATEDMKAEMRKVYFKAYVLADGDSNNSGEKFWLKLNKNNSFTNDWQLQSVTSQNGFTYATSNSFTSKENATKMYIDDDFIGTALEGSVTVTMPDTLLNADGSTLKFKSEIHFVEEGIDNGLWSYISSNNTNSAFVNIQRYFKFTFTKIDSEGKYSYYRTPVSGAKYGLYDTKLNKLLETAVSSSNGTVSFNTKLTFDLENPRRYYVQELVAPEGYVFDDTKYYIWGDAFSNVAEAIRENMEGSETSNGFFNNYSLNSTYTNVYNVQFSNQPEHSIISGFAADESGFHAVITEAGKLTTYVAEQPTKGNIEIMKYDDFGQPIKGVTFELKVGSSDITRKVYASENECVTYNGISLKAGTIIATAKTNENGKAEFKNLPLGEYVIYEKAPAEGDAYVITDKQYTITLKANGNEPIVTETKEIVNESQKVKLTIEKCDPNGKLITNNPAEFKVLAAEDFYFNGKLIHKKGDTVIASMKTDEEGCAHSWYQKGTMTVYEPLYVGATYKLIEVVPPKGYKINTHLEEEEFTVPQTSEINIEYVPYKITVLDEEDDTQILFSKRQLGTTNELKGAELAIYHAGDFDASANKPKENVKAYDKWTSDGTYHEVSDFEEGDYYFIETFAPNGYLISTSIKFHIDADGKVTSNDTTITYEGEIPIIIMYDDYTVIDISKLDITGKPEVEGASLAVYEADENGKPTGNAIESWVSEKNVVHSIVAKLVPNKKYVLRETSSPAGFAKSEDVVFTVDENCNSTTHQTVTMTDDYIEVHISKKEITGSEELSGATLEIYNADGNGKRTGTALESWISGTEDHTIQYKLEEGKTYILHEVSAPNGHLVAEDVPFVVSGTSTNSQTVTMYDKYTTVTIYKVEAGTVTALSDGKVVTGAVLQLLDESKNPVLDGEGKEIIWTSGSESKTFTKFLNVGSTYYIREITAPKGYVKNTEDTKIVIANTADEQKFYVNNAPNELHVSKVDITNSQELEGAELKITDLNGNIAKTEDGEELKWTSTGNAKIWHKIAAGSYYLVETSAPDGYTITEKVGFTIDEGNRVTTVKMEDDVSHIEINKVDSENSSLLKGAVLQLTCVPNNTNANLNNIIFTKPTGSEALESAFAGKYTFGVNGLTVTWISGEKDNAVFKKLPNGKYTITELEAPEGYTKLTTSIEFEIINGRAYNNDGKPYTLISVDNSKSEFYVAKVNEEGTPVAGVKLQLWNEQGQMVKEWTTTSKPEEFKGLPYGKYTVKEIAPADKTYNKADDMVFVHDGNNNGKTYYMLNTHGFVMPETGGIGTGIFTIIGSLMLTIGLAFTLKRKRITNI